MVGAKEEEKAAAVELFLKIGIEEKTAKNTIANPKLTNNLTAIIHEAGLEDRSVGNLIYTVAGKYPNIALVHRPTLLNYIVVVPRPALIKSSAQLDAAHSFLSSTASESLSVEEFEKACGVGVVVTLEDIKQAVAEVIEENKASILELRYRTKVGELYGSVIARHRWADPKIVKELIDGKLYELLGEKTAADNEKPSKKKKEKPVKETKAVEDDPVQPSEEQLNPFLIFPSPEENFKVHTEVFFSDSSVLRCCNTKEMLEKHLKVTGRKVFTRFPPEPNGYLHIGHAKAMFVSFGLAKERDGHCYLRYDDTNPEAEKKEYIDHIEEIVEWMGWKPFKITCTSDYFQDLHDLAVELIRRGHTYVDHHVLLIGGTCYTYDDTNPEAEKKEYIDHIEEIVEWMGWKPFKITYTSDYFQDLHDLAVELIRRGHTYVDHQTPEEIKEYREKKMNSPWRDRPIAESLKLFDDMRNGLVEEGKATLRMKQDMQSDNYNMYDLIAYRIKFTPHPHAGDKWCIYPSYDYAHCIVDSLENITHSLCTLEFETRRASYYWLLHALGLYQPYVWEYSRLNITNTVMSKRKLNRLVSEKYVDGWDDPRLMTLAGLRRRGLTRTAINSFVRGIGITRSDGSLIHLSRLEHHIREELNETAPRRMVVLNPLKVVITNMDSGLITFHDAKQWPDRQREDASDLYKVPFSRVVYIEQSDFRMKDSKDYYGLAPGKSVFLKYGYHIKCTEVILADDKESVSELRAEYDPLSTAKPKKGVLHWVAEPSSGVEPLKVEVRLFDKLFNSENPSDLGYNWLSDLNPQSKVIMPNAFAVPALKNAAAGERFQFERLGYFIVDKDSTPEKLVFHQTVTLKDSYGKGGK